MKAKSKFIFALALVAAAVNISIDGRSTALNTEKKGVNISFPELLPEEKNVQKNRADENPESIFNSNLKKIFKRSGQFLIVLSKDWKSPDAELVYYEKKDGKLKKISDKVPVNLGSGGLGWGNGLIEFGQSGGPVKREGDGRSPAGIFSLSYAFGYLPQDSLSWLNYPYRQVTKRIECVDDTSSVYYNTLMDLDKTPKSWNSSETMRGRGPHYKYGIFVDHNSNPRIPGCGSCIFIHVWAGSGKPTSGCTDMAEEEIVKLLRWLSVKKKPILIQLPEKEFEKIKSQLTL